MLVVLGFLFLSAVVLLIISILWFVINRARGRKVKRPLLTLVSSIAVMALMITFSNWIDSDYNVTNRTAGNDFYALLDQGEVMEGKTLTFTVDEKGASDVIGMSAFKVPSSEKYVTDILLADDKKTQAIHTGDTVSVKITQVSNLMGIYLINAELE
ncbi:MAG: hypothetical protein ACK5MW_01700 [Enterococcus sp.]